MRLSLANCTSIWCSQADVGRGETAEEGALDSNTPALGVVDAALGGDGARRRQVVSGDHAHGNVSALAVSDRAGDLRTKRVLETCTNTKA